MDSNAEKELRLIKKELNLLINEIELISTGIRKDFSGIGNEKCAAALNSIASNYYTVRRNLNNLNTSSVTESFAKSHLDDGSDF